jgi:hypothetical protein
MIKNTRIMHPSRVEGGIRVYGHFLKVLPFEEQEGAILLARICNTSTSIIFSYIL